MFLYLQGIVHKNNFFFKFHKGEIKINTINKGCKSSNFLKALIVVELEHLSQELLPVFSQVSKSMITKAPNDWRTTLQQALNIWDTVQLSETFEILITKFI